MFFLRVALIASCAHVRWHRPEAVRPAVGRGCRSGWGAVTVGPPGRATSPSPQAKADGHPVVLMAFSSMPVSREEILTTAALIVEKCTPQPAVIAMMGSRPAEKIGADLEKRVEGFKARGLLLEGKAAPFGQLLPRMDCNIIHGGLGTTAESMRAGKPVLVTGILLMDQRFWAKQVLGNSASPEGGVGWGGGLTPPPPRTRISSCEKMKFYKRKY